MNENLNFASNLDLSTRDADVIASAVTRLFGHHVMTSCGKADGLRSLTARPVSGFLIGDLRYASNMTCIADEPRSRVCLTVPHRCGGRMGNTRYEPGDVLAFNPEWVGRIELTPPGNFRNTCFTPEQIRFGMRALLGSEADELPVFTDRLPGDSAAAQRVLQVLHFLHDHRADSAILRRARESWALLEILDAWPHSYSSRMDGPKLPPRALRRAIDFIETHLDRPIALADIALAASVGARALNEAFHNHLSETPGRYLRGRRLEAARVALLAEERCTVEEVAVRWQFSNPGVFARYFRERFGCLPSELTRRSGRRA